jgi:hypothetical protein
MRQPMTGGATSPSLPQTSSSSISQVVRSRSSRSFATRRVRPTGIAPVRAPCCSRAVLAESTGPGSPLAIPPVPTLPGPAPPPGMSPPGRRIQHRRHRVGPQVRFYRHRADNQDHRQEHSRAARVLRAMISQRVLRHVSAVPAIRKGRVRSGIEAGEFGPAQWSPPTSPRACPVDLALRVR